MKIDFYTRYLPKHFEKLCEKAIRLGLDGLVMTGLPNNKDLQYNGLKIFPAQELDWIAAMEIPEYNSMEDFRNDKKAKTDTRIYHGKALTILPSNKEFLLNPDKRLYQLLEQVTNAEGVSIALQDDNTSPITIGTDNNAKPLYPFNAIRIRPYNTHDINSELEFAKNPFLRSVVAGSKASKPEDLLSTNSAFTVYEISINSRDKLIQAIKNRLPTQLKVFQPRKFSFLKPIEIDIKDTVQTSKIIIHPEIISELLRS